MVITYPKYQDFLIVILALGISAWIYLQKAFTLFGQIAKDSKDCLFLWKGTFRAYPAWFRRFHKSCPSLKMSIGRMYFADKQMTLTMTEAIVGKIAEAVLAN